MDFAIINLNSMLEAEASARGGGRGGGASDASGSGRRGGIGGGGGDDDGPHSSLQVVVIDSMGRAQTLSARDISQLTMAGLGRGMMDVDEMIANERWGRVHVVTRSFARLKRGA